MMNYIELNGVKSTTVKGLLISSLPPISKPLMRTEIEEIDGRDGDIVTKLGYSAYDKEMTIGLFGDYNVDDVIAYFDSEGVVTFSNEPDKFYNYQILEQIDLERLMHFRTATVTFHVQPFKFSAVDSPVSFSEDLLSFKDYRVSSGGVTLTAKDGVISVTGTTIAPAEIYVPINAVSLNAGRYTLSAYAQGTNVEACGVRLVKDVPAASFGNSSIPLGNGATGTITSAVTAGTGFNYLYFAIGGGATVSFACSMALINTEHVGLNVRNSGNTVAKPVITISGSGAIQLLFNGKHVMTVALGNERIVTLDGLKMEAYCGDMLKNRVVIGDYDDMVLKRGVNTISWTGGVTGIKVTHFSRWI